MKKEFSSASMSEGEKIVQMETLELCWLAVKKNITRSIQEKPGGR